MLEDQALLEQVWRGIDLGHTEWENYKAFGDGFDSPDDDVYGGNKSEWKEKESKHIDHETCIEMDIWVDKAVSTRWWQESQQEKKHGIMTMKVTMTMM